MSKILNKKIENLALEKKILTNLYSNFPKRKRNLVFKKDRLKCILSSPKLSRRELLKIEVYKKLTHATCNVTFCINIQVQNTPLSQKLEPEHFYSFLSRFFLLLSMASTTETYCTFALYEASPTLSLPISNMGIIELRITQRNQIQVQLNPSSSNIVIEDIVSPTFHACLEIPLLVMALPSFRELYVSHELNGLNLDHNLLEYLKEQIETNVFGELERSGFWGGFEIVAEVGVFKVEVLDRDEVDRIACKVFQMNGTTADSSKGVATQELTEIECEIK